MGCVKKRELYDGTAFGLCNKKNIFFLQLPTLCGTK
jgi:hypothetical protein